MKATRWGLIFTLLIFFQLALQAQGKQNAESAFLKEINNVLIQHPPDAGFNTMYHVDSIMIDSPFTIKEGILSVTYRYAANSTFVKIRAAAPVSHLTEVGYDHYLILLFKDKAVTQYQFEGNDNIATETIKKDLLHIGTPVKDGYGEKENLQKLLNKLLKYYKE